MLDQLPLDLFRIITEHFACVDVKQLSRVDIAFCNRRRRSDWLQLLKHLRHVRTIDIDPHAEDRKGFRSGPSLDRYLNWIVSRGVHVSRLQLDLSLFIEPLFSPRPKPAFKQTIPSIDTLYLYETRAGGSVPVNFTCFLSFLDCFPSLRHLKCWTILDNELTGIVRKLKGDNLSLDLLYCFGLTWRGGIAAICSLGDRLTELSAGLEGSGMVTIAEHCHNLRTLHVDCKYSTHMPFAELEQLCAANVALTSLTLVGAVPFAVLCRIASTCPKLECLISKDSTVGVDKDTGQLIALLVAHCPMLHTLQLLSQSMRFVQDRHGGKTAEISYQTYTTIYHAEFLSGISIPVRKYHLALYGYEQKDSLFGGMTDIFGSSLESLCLDTFYSTPRRFVHDDDIDGFVGLLKGCPYLTEWAVNLSFCSADYIRDLLSLLPSSCPHLQKIKFGVSTLTGSPYVDLTSFLNGFRALPDNAVEELQFNWTATMSDAALCLIADVFPRLQHFRDQSNFVNIKLLCNLLVSDKLKAKGIKVSREHRQRLMDELHKRGVPCSCRGASEMDSTLFIGYC